MLGWILAVVGLVVVTGWIVARFVARRFAAGIAADLDAVRAVPATVADPVDLPPLLEAFVARIERVSELPGLGRRGSRVAQTGEMRLQPGGAWRPFKAIQRYAVAEPAFVWQARFRSFTVVDGIVGGAGRLEARLWGVVPVMRASGTAVAAAQLLRYLAEIAWVPGAIRGNRHITWRQLDAARVLGAIEHSGRRGELCFHFANGALVLVEGMRDRLVGNASRRTAWSGAFSDYEMVDGLWLPTRAEVAWQLDSGPFPYWRGRVTGVQVD